MNTITCQAGRLLLNRSDANGKSDDDNYRPADFAGLKTQGCTSANQVLSTRDGYTQFATAVNNCDGGVCRFCRVDDSLYLQKAHLVPYSKGFEMSVIILPTRNGS
jgi:hypothetical protein